MSISEFFTGEQVLGVLDCIMELKGMLAPLLLKDKKFRDQWLPGFRTKWGCIGRAQRISRMVKIL